MVYTYRIHAQRTKFSETKLCDKATHCIVCAPEIGLTYKAKSRIVEARKRKF
jgi:hypothetical protein